MKKIIIAALAVLFSANAFAENTEYRVTRVQAPFTSPLGDKISGDTVRSSLYNVRSQAFITQGAFQLKMEICASPAWPGCRGVLEKYRFLSFDGRNLNVEDMHGDRHTITVLRLDPLRVVLPGDVTVDFKEVAFSGVDRHRDITEVLSIRDALTDIQENDEAIDFFAVF